MPYSTMKKKNGLFYAVQMENQPLIWQRLYIEGKNKQTNKQKTTTKSKQTNTHTHTQKKKKNEISSCVHSEIAQAQIKAVDLSVMVCSGLLKQEFFDQRNSMTREEADLVRWKTRSTRTSIGPSPFSSSSSSAFNSCVTVWDLQPLWTSTAPQLLLQDCALCSQSGLRKGRAWGTCCFKCDYQDARRSTTGWCFR